MRWGKLSFLIFIWEREGGDGRRTYLTVSVRLRCEMRFVLYHLSNRVWLLMLGQVICLLDWICSFLFDCWALNSNIKRIELG